MGICFYVSVWGDCFPTTLGLMFRCGVCPVDIPAHLLGGHGAHSQVAQSTWQGSWATMRGLFGQLIHASYAASVLQDATPLCQLADQISHNMSLFPTTSASTISQHSKTIHMGRGRLGIRLWLWQLSWTM